VITYISGVFATSDSSNPYATEPIGSINDLFFVFIIPAFLLYGLIRWIGGRDQRRLRRWHLEDEEERRAELRQRLQKEKDE
jgi:hypothetical protein